MIFQCSFIIFTRGCEIPSYASYNKKPIAQLTISNYRQLQLADDFNYQCEGSVNTSIKWFGSQDKRHIQCGRRMISVTCKDSVHITENNMLCSPNTLIRAEQLARVTCNVIMWTRGWPPTLTEWLR